MTRKSQARMTKPTTRRRSERVSRRARPTRQTKARVLTMARPTKERALTRQPRRRKQSKVGG